MSDGITKEHKTQNIKPHEWGEGGDSNNCGCLWKLRVYFLLICHIFKKSIISLPSFCSEGEKLLKTIKCLTKPNI